MYQYHVKHVAFLLLSDIVDFIHKQIENFRKLTGKAWIYLISFCDFDIINTFLFPLLILSSALAKDHDSLYPLGTALGSYIQEQD